MTNGNKAYYPYQQKNIVFSKLNLFEVFLSCLRQFDIEEASLFLHDFEIFAKEYDGAVIEEAAVLKQANKKKKLSMSDCIGYCMAKQFGIRFLTGDKEFEGMENVEFVK